MKEQEIIRRYFSFSKDSSVIVGVGDDAAVMMPPDNSQLLVSTDTLVENTHFFSDVSPFDLSYKAAAVSLSDIAAMGGKPKWMTVSLTATEKTNHWFEEIAKGLTQSSTLYDYTIIGGDLTQGKILSITTTIIGITNTSPLLRHSAMVGDDIWVSGLLGGAAHATGSRLKNYPLATKEHMDFSYQRLHQPTPRLSLGQAIQSFATSAMDISDGLLITARSIGEASQVCLQIQAKNIPSAPSLSALSEKDRWHCLLAGGDDYELLFTAPITQRHHIEIMNNPSLPITRIGSVIQGTGVSLYHDKTIEITEEGYEHHF